MRFLNSFIKMKRLKILHVIAGMNPEMGGVCAAVSTMITGLSAFDIDNEVVSLDAADADYIKEYNFKIYVTGEGKGAWKYSSNLAIWLKTNLALFDIVIVHGIWLYPGFAVRKTIKYFKKNGIHFPKLYVMPHGMLDPYFQVTSGRKIKALRNWIFWKIIEQKLIATADGLLFTCEMEKGLARKTFRPYNPKKELVVGLGIKDPPEHTPVMEKAFFQKTAIVKECPYILYLSRLDEKKGIDLLIRAYLKIEKINSNMPALVIAGPGLETSFGVKMQKLAQASSKIYFTGMLVGDVKWGAFYGCEAFILPSHQENFGIAVIEAMACGKVVLISNQINIWKEIGQFGGSIICKDTLEETQKMLAYWISLSIEKKQTMSMSAKKCFNRFFTIDIVSKKLMDAISDY